MDLFSLALVLNEKLIKTVVNIFCRAVYLLPDEYFFALSLLMRILGGFGSSMLTVAMISTLMKATSFKSTTVIVSESINMVEK